MTNFYHNFGTGTNSFRSGADLVTGQITGYAWEQKPYRGSFNSIFYSELKPMDLLLNYNGPNGGWFTGFIYTSYPFFGFDVAGTFTSN